MALYTHRFHICKFKPMETQKYSGKKKNSRKFHKETLNLLCPGSVYTAFTLCLQLFTQHLHCIRHYKHRRQWHPTPVLLPGKSHGRRSLVGCSPWGCKESDMTEQLHFHFSLSCIGEGNGNPLQCSCLENPRDRGAWWAAISGVAQSWI